jgi:hypothetical protein
MVIAKMWPGVLQKNCIVWIIEPASPVFDDVNDPQLRALVAVGLGCDTWPGGILNLGPSKMIKLLQTLNLSNLGPDTDRGQELVEEALVAWPKSPVKDPRVLLCFADAFMYEKTKLSYTSGRPENVDKYLEEFADEGTSSIVTDLEILECAGIRLDDCHCSLAAEQARTCNITSWPETCSLGTVWILCTLGPVQGCIEAIQ